MTPPSCPVCNLSGETKQILSSRTNMPCQWGQNMPSTANWDRSALATQEASCLGHQRHSSDMLIRWSSRSPEIHETIWKLNILLHRWTAGLICPDGYGPYLSFPPGTSQEITLHEPGDHPRIGARNVPASGRALRAFTKTFPRKSPMKMKGKDYIYLDK